MSNVPMTVFRGPSLASILTVLFVALKLTGNIAWSWWWVLSPLWISAIITIALLLIIGGIAIVVAAKS